MGRNRRFLIIPSAILTAALGVPAAELRAQGTMGVPIWTQSYEAGVPPSAIRTPLASRFLADGTFMVVTSDGGLPAQAVRYGADGAVASQVPLGLSPAAVASIDAFGTVFTAAPVGAAIKTMRFDGSTGLPVWQATTPLAGSGYVTARKSETDPRGDFIVVAANDRTFLMKMRAADGSLAWGPIEISLPASSYLGPILAVDGSGNALIAASNFGPPTPVVTTKVDGRSGGVLWSSALQGTATRVLGMAVDSHGDIFQVGSGVKRTGNGWQFLVARLRGTDGAVLWTSRTNVTLDTAYSAAVDSAGNVVVSGLSSNFPPAGPGDSRVLQDVAFSFMTVKYDGRTGAVLWGPILEGLSPYQFGNIFPHAVAIDGHGDAFVTGGKGDAMVTIKYDGGAGRRLWRADESGVSAFNFGHQLAISPAGDPIATGAIYSAPYISSCATVRYDTRTGARVWGPRLVAGIVGGIRLAKTAVTPSGDVVEAVGYGTSACSARDVFKYSGASGAVLWGPVRFVSTALQCGGYDDFAISLDSSGNVFVAAGEYDFTWQSPAAHSLLAKLDGTTGSILWETPEVPDIDARSLIDDAEGGMILIGGHGTGLAAARFDGITGQVLWEKNIAATAQDSPFGSALLVPGTIGSAAVAISCRVDNQGLAAVAVSVADGSVIWGPTTIATSEVTPYLGSTLQVGNSGNVFVSGTVRTGGRQKIVTGEIAAMTGSNLWGPAVLGDPSLDVSSAQMQVDPNGDVIITGTRGSFPASITTEKLAGATGATIWGPLDYVDPDLGSNAAAATVLAGNDIVIAGDVQNRASPALGFPILRRSGIDGSIEWADRWGRTEAVSVPMEVRPLGTDFVMPVLATGGRLLTIRFGERPAPLSPDPSGLPSAFCALPYDFTIPASGGTPPYTWGIVNGALPPGLVLDTFSGRIFGTSDAEGEYAFRLRVMDSAGGHADADVVLGVFESEAAIPVTAMRFPGPMAGFTLSSPSGFSSYRWLPNGETTPSIRVNPTNPTVYGVVVGEADGCTRRGSVVVGP